MAALFLDSWKLANFVDATETPDAEDFRRRVQQAIVKVAGLVAGESIGSLTTKQWDTRASLAATVLGTQFVGDPIVPKAGSEIWLDTFANITANNVAITSASTDADIEFTVTSAWDDVAGVTGNDLT